MSTASPLPLQPLPPSTVSEAETRALKQQVASRLAEHRQRRPRTGDAQASLPMETPQPGRSRVADSVAARFARSVSYRDYLQQEAETAVRQAEAAAEVARRTADAIAAAQQQLLDEIDQWNVHEHAEVLPFVVASDEDSTDVAGNSEQVAAHSAEAAVTADTFVAVHTVAAEAAHIPAPTIAEASVFTETAPAFVLPQEPAEPAIPLPTNLIEFPRQLVAARRARPRLAEGPLREEADAAPERAQLRIFEVEASSVSTEVVVESALPEWHSIRLDAHAEPRAAVSHEAQISFALPLYVAPMSQRMMAALVDACCVATGVLAAIAAAAYASPELPTGAMAAISVAGALAAFAILYQVLFFSLSGATPGMRYARLGLCTFGDENPTRSSMRRRVLALMLACIPLGLGLLWACLDEEGLGWHDRISRMYPRAY